MLSDNITDQISSSIELSNTLSLCMMSTSTVMDVTPPPESSGWETLSPDFAKDALHERFVVFFALLRRLGRTSIVFRNSRRSPLCSRVWRMSCRKYYGLFVHKHGYSLMTVQELDGTDSTEQYFTVCFKCLFRRYDYFRSPWTASEKASPQVLCRETVVWKQLHHKHIPPFIGVDHITMPHAQSLISPCMDNGNVTQYLKNQRNPDPLKLTFVCFVNYESYPCILIVVAHRFVKLLQRSSSFIALIP